MKMIKRFTLVLSSMVLASMALTSHAQYPESPVKMIVGFPPGQATDIVARYMAQKSLDRISS
jgi:tripartite-type tricarboxylate transporter receptor subunit TctC